MQSKCANIHPLSIKLATNCSDCVKINGQINEGFTNTEKQYVFHNRKGDTKSYPSTDTVLPAVTLRGVNNDTSDTVDDKEEQVEYTTKEDGALIYKVSDRTPVHLTMLFAMQQALLSLAASITVSLLVSDVVCAENNDEIKTKLLSSTLLMNGITTLMMITVGIRLPLYQGASADYVAPLLAMAEVEKGRCNFTRTIINSTDGTNVTIVESNEEEVILGLLTSLQGSLIAAGAIHFLIGATGLVGVLLRFIGPVTIVPTILLVGIYIMKAVTKFTQYHWGLALMTAAVAIILSLYFANMKMLIPMWNTRKGCHVIRYPLHQVFAILIALLVGWFVCFIMTVAGAFSDDPNHKEFYSRTDSRNDIITKAGWFYFPYPGQFGTFGFSINAFIGFLVATIISILDSIGDYYACASTCRVPPPPTHGVNRGIAIEGFCTAFSGAVGCGHATGTYGGNIGAIGLTRVASRWVFVGVAVIYIIFGIIGKVSAVFITIPYPVLGGVLIVMFGAFNGVVLSNLKVVDLSSTRNLTIIGTSLLVGLMVPHWARDYSYDLGTGSQKADKVIKMLLVNPNICGGILACFLDNTIPGTLEERGIAEWQMTEITPERKSKYLEGFEVYKPVLPKRLMESKIMRYLPFMPNPGEIKSN